MAAHFIDGEMGSEWSHHLSRPSCPYPAASPGVGWPRWRSLGLAPCGQSLQAVCPSQAPGLSVGLEGHLHRKMVTDGQGLEGEGAKPETLLSSQSHKHHPGKLPPTQEGAHWVSKQTAASGGGGVGIYASCGLWVGWEHSLRTPLQGRKSFLHCHRRFVPSGQT